MTLLLAAIDTAALRDVVIASIAAGVVIVGSYSLCLYGVAAYVERRHTDRANQALPFAVLAALGGVLFAGAVVYGFIIMTSK